MRWMNVVLAVLMLGLAWLGWNETYALSAQSAEFPLIVAALFTAAGVLLLFSSLVVGVGAGVFPFANVPWRHLLPVIAALVLFVFALDRVGFYEASFLFVILTCLLLWVGDFSRPLMQRAVVATGFAFIFISVVYVAFHHVLGVPTPPGTLL
jgi:hypothetical protein